MSCLGLLRRQAVRLLTFTFLASANIEKLTNISSLYKKTTFFRLDFNGSYSTKEAIKICRELSEYNVEYIEEPFMNINENDENKKIRHFNPDESIKNLSIYPPTDST